MAGVVPLVSSFSFLVRRAYRVHVGAGIKMEWYIPEALRQITTVGQESPGILGGAGITSDLT